MACKPLDPPFRDILPARFAGMLITVALVIEAAPTVEELENDLVGSSAHIDGRNWYGLLEAAGAYQSRIVADIQNTLVCCTDVEAPNSASV